MTDEIADTIEVKLKETTAYIRWPCHVCGGWTDKVDMLAESDDGFRVCETCLKAGDIDERLARRADEFEAQAARCADELKEAAAEIRALIGRVRAPSYAEWWARTDRINVAHFAAYAVGEGSGFEGGEYDRVMTDDLAYARWRPKRDAEQRAMGF